MFFKKCSSLEKKIAFPQCNLQLYNPGQPPTVDQRHEPLKAYLCKDSAFRVQVLLQATYKVLQQFRHIKSKWTKVHPQKMKPFESSSALLRLANRHEQQMSRRKSISLGESQKPQAERGTKGQN
jgi:hypothetical protein